MASPQLSVSPCQTIGDFVEMPRLVERYGGAVAAGKVTIAMSWCGGMLCEGSIWLMTAVVTAVDARGEEASLVGRPRMGVAVGMASSLSFMARKMPFISLRSLDGESFGGEVARSSTKLRILRTIGGMLASEGSHHWWTEGRDQSVAILLRKEGAKMYL